MRVTVPALFAIALLAAGCIAPPDGDASVTRTPSAGGEMTATEKQDEAVALCQAGLDLPSNGARYCAERTLTIGGSLTGIDAMDVDLETFNGGVDVSSAPEGTWSLKVVLRARGDTEAEARQGLDRISFTWSHVDAGVHALVAKAKPPREDHNGLSAQLSAALPRSTILALSAQSSNGNVKVEDLRTEGLFLQTSNGNVDVKADVTHVALGTSNGNVDARLTPTDSGSVDIGTSNGKVLVTLPESSRVGYDVDAVTSNGKVTISLRDGETTRKGASNPYYDPQNDGRFTTHGFEDRDVRSFLVIASSNGAIDVKPA